MQVEISTDEANFIKQILSSVTINAGDPNSLGVVMFSQSLIGKMNLIITPPAQNIPPALPIPEKPAD
jgi:hypothetical protein